MPASGPLTARLASRTLIAPTVADLVFDMVAPETLPFQAGQFVTLSVGRDAQGKDARRSYSIASMSDRGQSLRFIIRVIPGGLASDLFMSMPLGSAVEMTGPHGFFVLDPQHAGDVLFAATGTGIAPVLPMLHELERRTEAGRRMVYWGLRSESDLFSIDEVGAACAAAGASLATYLSRPAAGWAGPRGRITPVILDALPTLRTPTFYLVGNGAMIDQLKQGLVAAGIQRKKQIRSEAFFD